MTHATMVGSINEDLVGQTRAARRRSWTSKDALLYSLAVGAGQQDPLSELEFTTENTSGRPQRVFPTFSCVAMGGGPPELPPGIDLSKMLHAEQSFELHRELPVEGEALITSRVTDVLDKGRGALAVNETTAVDPEGNPLVTIRGSFFFQGYGGWGGPRGEKATWQRPSSPPDFLVEYPIRQDQALLYRLTGDRNPLHSDPVFAARGGFARPILHGMCTFGFAGRALTHTVAGSDPSRLRRMSARFAKPMLSGQTLTMSIWNCGPTILFQAADESGDIILDHGTAVVEPTSTL